MRYEAVAVQRVARAGLNAGISAVERVRNLVVQLRASLWLLPAGIGVVGFVLAYVLQQLPASLLDADLARRWSIFSGDAETARQLLATLAGGMISMTSLVVSITVVVLTLAANQLGPRLVANFMGDRQIKTVLGLFIGTIIYLLTVLRGLDHALPAAQMPYLAVTFGTALTILCLFALLFYIHKIARSIISDTVVREVASSLRETVAATLVEHVPDSVELAPTREDGAERHSIALDKLGYIQVIDYAALTDLATRKDLLIRLHVRPGHFVLRAGRHIEVEGADADGCGKAVRACFVIGAERSPAQDIEFAIRQLVEIALRALSPGINDPFTAIAVINALGGALAEMLARPMPPVAYRDKHGRVRVLADVSDHAGLLDAAFNQIRQAGQTHPAILIELAEILGKLVPSARECGASRRHSASSGDDPACRAPAYRRAAGLGRPVAQG